MLLKILIVYDSKSETYMQPFFTQTIGVAIRMVTETCNDPSHTFCKYPEDYTLFHIGEYDDNTSSLVHHAPISLGNMVQFKHPLETVTPLEAAIKDHENGE